MAENLVQRLGNRVSHFNVGAAVSFSHLIVPASHGLNLLLRSKSFEKFLKERGDLQNELKQLVREHANRLDKGMYLAGRTFGYGFLGMLGYQVIQITKC